jgi:triacylglycerol lipase
MIAFLLRLMLAATLVAGGLFGYWLVPHAPYTWYVSGFFALLFVPFSHAIGLIPGFALSEMADQDADARHGRSGPSALLRAYLSEIAASTWAFCCLQALGRWTTSNSPATSEVAAALPCPILLVHGYFCNRLMWSPLARYWRKSPRNAMRQVEAITLTPAFAGLDQHADQLHDHVRRLHAKTGRRVVLVAHSMGGLVVRAYLRKHSADWVKGVVTLGTPHQGTVMADYGHGPSVRQMRLGSAWLEALADHEREHRLPPFEVILSLHDNIVAPRHIQTIPGANLQMVEGIGHMGLAQSEDIWRLIDNILAHWERK